MIFDYVSGSSGPDQWLLTVSLIGAPNMVRSAITDAKLDVTFLVLDLTLLLLLFILIKLWRLGCLLSFELVNKLLKVKKLANRLKIQHSGDPA